MKKLKILTLLAYFGIQYGYSQEKYNYAAFDWFEYEGKDSLFSQIILKENEYLNPILPGFYPDPSICRVNDDYYLVNSSFSYFPGVPIFHSTDLVNWQQIGHILNRPSQLNLDQLPISYGIYAPTLRYHNGVFYMITTLVGGKDNFYVTANNPSGPWSDPIWLPEIQGIDPSFFFDENNKAYIINNGPPPENKELYEGHRAIWIQEFDLSSGKLTGPRKIIVNGGSDISKKPVWIEGPHIFKTKGFYYLIAAEGGTGDEHSEVVFRSEDVWGPYLPFEGNPILTQRKLDKNRKNPVSSTGHADFVELPDGTWWVVFLGCRPYDNGFYNTGRETFMLPVHWDGQWPIITNSNEEVKYVNKNPYLPAQAKTLSPMNGNFKVRDDFNSETLSYTWNLIRTPRDTWYSLKEKPGSLIIRPRPVAIYSNGNPSFIGRRQQHTNFSASASMQFNPLSSKNTAGMVAFQNEKFYLFLGVKKVDNSAQIFVESSGSNLNNGKPTIIANAPLAQTQNVYLKIDGKGRYYSFYYATKQDQWVLLKENVDASILSTKIAGGFVGTYIGMYAFNEE